MNENQSTHNHTTKDDATRAIAEFPRRKARSLRFTAGAPRSAQVVGDGRRALFLRSDGPEDLVTSLWMSVIDDSDAHEVKLADPRDLLADADREDVPAEEKARRERAREGGEGIVSYAVDAEGTRAVFTINSRLFLTEIDQAGAEDSAAEKATRQVLPEVLPDPQWQPVLNPRISPDGMHVLYSTGARLVMVDIPSEPGKAGRDRVYEMAHIPQSADPETCRIGLAEFAAGEEMDRYDGFWWSPAGDEVLFEQFDSSDEPVWYITEPSEPEHGASGRHYPRALTRNARVTMALASLRFDENESYTGCDIHAVDWDAERYEYMAAVSWTAGHRPVMLVQNRRQNRDQVLGVSSDGTTSVLEEHANPQWLDLVGGTPAMSPGGRLVCAMNDMDTDANRLTVDGKAFTPVGWQVRQVLDVGTSDVLAVVQRDARSMDVVTIGFDDGAITRVSNAPGVWSASRSGRGIVVSGRDMDHAQTQMTHRLADVEHRVENHSATPGFTPNVEFVTLGEHRMYAALIRPSASSRRSGAEKLPVLLKPYGGPGHQEVLFAQSNYWDAQWWADQGFLVVTVDNRGTTGRGPKWDREIFEDMKAVSLADQVEAVHALPKVAPDADLEHVAMIGWSYGGFLSALAVLEAPETIHAACAGAPPTDWTLYDTHYTERYLGLEPKVYERNSIIADAPELTRPLMLIHGFADDNVTIAHSLRLSQALTAAGRPHTYLPLVGITHMTNDETVAENLLILQRDFLYDALGID